MPKFIEFTVVGIDENVNKEDVTPFFINPKHITCFYPSEMGGTNIVLVNGQKYEIDESIDNVKSKILGEQ